MDIIETLQEKVNEIVNIKYEKDQCKPIFTVSLIQKYDITGKIRNHEIGLTVQHLGQCFTRTIFPLPHHIYGYPNLEEEIEDLYNNTM